MVSLHIVLLTCEMGWKETPQKYTIIASGPSSSKGVLSRSVMVITNHPMGRIREGPVPTVNPQGHRRPWLVGWSLSLCHCMLTFGTGGWDTARQARHPVSVSHGHFYGDTEATSLPSCGSWKWSCILCFPLPQRTQQGELTEVKRHPALWVSQMWYRAFTGQSRNRAEAEVLRSNDREGSKLRGSRNSIFLRYEQGQKKKRKKVS